MSLSDCPKCWDTPCTCGHEYESWSKEGIYKHIAMLARVLTVKENKPLQSIVDGMIEACKKEGLQ